MLWVKTFTNPDYLRNQQYKTADNLNKRASLHVRFRTNPYPWHRWVFDQVRELEDARILDVGCGPGYLWAENLDRIPASWLVHLIDLSFGMVKTAKKDIGEGKFSFSNGDAQRIPSASNQLDAVTANHILFHVPEIERALSEIRRVLKPGGRLYATTNGFRNLIEIWEWVAEALPARTDIMSSRESILSFSLENGEEQLSRYFSKVKLIHYPDSLVIDEVQPIVDFVVSSNMQVSLSKGELARYKIFLEKKLRAEKALKITKDTGIFVAE